MGRYSSLPAGLQAGTARSCDLLDSCTIKEPLAKVNDTISDVLKGIRIADLVDAIPYDRRIHMNGGHARPLVTLG